MKSRKPPAPASEAAPAEPDAPPAATPDPLPLMGESLLSGRGAGRGTRAVRAVQVAERLEQRSAFDWTDRVLKPGEARRSREEAHRLLKPDRELIRGGSEVTQRPDADGPWDAKRASLIDTLEQPNMISVEASELRASELMHLDILAPGLDAALTAGANNSLEKMLCHQMAAAHHAAMRLLGDAIGPNGFTRLPIVERVRLVNAGARMVAVYQSGLLTLQRLRTGGRQEVVVQHVQVNEGGQAVVAGNVKTHKRRGGRRGEE